MAEKRWGVEEDDIVEKKLSKKMMKEGGSFVFSNQINAFLSAFLRMRAENIFACDPLKNLFLSLP